MNIEKNSLDYFNPNKEENEKPFVSHIQKPKRKKKQINIIQNIFSPHKI